MTEKTHWKQLVNPNYLGVYSLPDGQDMTITIESVKREMVVQAGGKKEECTIAKIIGNKPMILNRTNCKTISKLYDSPYIEDWVNKQITIYASTTKLAGEVVECLRVRPVVIAAKPQAKPEISSERLAKAIAAIKSGTAKKEDVLNNFSLTDAQHAAILEA